LEEQYHKRCENFVAATTTHLSEQTCGFCRWVVGRAQVNQAREFGNGRIEMLEHAQAHGGLPDTKTRDLAGTHEQIVLDRHDVAFDVETSSTSSTSSSFDEKLQRSCSPTLVGDPDETDYDDAVAADKANVWHHMLNQRAAPDALMITSGKGLRVWDHRGKEFIDATSGGLWTVNVGYGREEIANAVRDQLLQLNFFSQVAANVPGARFAEMLTSKMPGMTRVYYSSSGSEANEKAFKMVRLIAHQKYGGKKHKILYRERDYHGTTLGALSATGQNQRRQGFGPWVPGFVEVPHCYEYRSQWGEVDDYGIRAANEIEKVILAEGPDAVGAICLEAITAGGGAIVPPSGYWERVQEICSKYQVTGLSGVRCAPLATSTPETTSCLLANTC